MRIIVSGATGFLGGHLCRRLRALGHEVMGLGRDTTKGAALEADGIQFEAMDHTLPNSRKIPSPHLRGEGKGEGFDRPKFQTPEPPVTPHPAFGHLLPSGGEKGFSDAEAFVHCAALSSNWGPREAFQAANVTGTRNALDLAERLGVRRFVHISSPSVSFRFRPQLDQREGDPLPAPVNAYAASKQQAETLVRARANSVILRPRGLYGQGDTALLPRLIRAAKDGRLPLLNHGEAVTDLTHIDDAVAAIVCVLNSDATGIYNISGGEPVAVKSIIEQACAHAGVESRFTAIPVGLAMTAARTAELIARLTPGQPEPIFTRYSVGVLAYSQTLDLTAAKRDLGYTPKVSFAEGLRRTFA